ncbi:MAG: response regulator [Acidobacteria bacterium]|nr:response regulator [Acidobacteriota bacterium]
MTTILVVDDNSMLRSVMERRLKRVGWSVLLATNGAEGVAVAKASLPDLILMDMTMPVMDGWTATRAIRSDPVTRHIPIVAFTAQPMTGENDDAVAAGCNGHIAKPFEFPDVLKKIRTLLAASAPSGQPGS